MKLSELKNAHILFNDGEDGDDPEGGDPEGGGGGGGGNEPPQGMIPEDILPEDLRGKSPAEQRFMLNRMVSSLTSSNEQTERLRRELQELRQKVETPPPEPDPDDELELAELLEKDPKKGIARALKEMGIANRFDTVAQSVNEITVSEVAREFPQFKEYREEVEELMNRSGSPYTKENIMGAFSMVYGQHKLEEELRGDRKKDLPTAGDPPPKGDPPEPKKDLPEMSQLEKEIFKNSGIESEEEWHRLKNDEAPEIGVPETVKGF